MATQCTTLVVTLRWIHLSSKTSPSRRCRKHGPKSLDTAASAGHHWTRGLCTRHLKGWHKIWLWLTDQQLTKIKWQPLNSGDIAGNHVQLWCYQLKWFNWFSTDRMTKQMWCPEFQDYVESFGSPQIVLADSKEQFPRFQMSILDLWPFSDIAK